MKKIDLAKIKKINLIRVIGDTVFFIGRHVFHFSLILTLIALLIGLAMLYSYGIIFNSGRALNGLDNCPLNEEAYNNVRDIWNHDEIIFKETKVRDYYNIFDID